MVALLLHRVKSGGKLIRRKIHYKCLAKSAHISIPTYARCFRNTQLIISSKTQNKNKRSFSTVTEGLPVVTKNKV